MEHFIFDKDTQTSATSGISQGKQWLIKKDG
jgi:hypothetical protein